MGLWLIKDNNKELLYDGVAENYTASYDGAPENENYVKYTIYPPASDEQIEAEI